MRGTRYRVPRKVKKAIKAFYRKAATPRQFELFARCHVVRSMGGWKRVRRCAFHVAMGDTGTARRRERREREREAMWS